ncbi:zinc finger MYM-type protein 1-like [Tripterygium wilfordii]|uniref:zinc finger MYM-type protein 1-like n=1 Tax=Tripterygium wilfordii TaxID=458696 RepID=UPI0018F8342B|nr:zinc finger MYM-type protein 1-like [Tripterygium wilfordii]
MKKFFKRKSVCESLSQPCEVPESVSNLKKACVGIDSANLPSNPELRPSIWSYDVNYRDEYRRVNLQRGPAQPRNLNFPYTLFGMDKRRFNPDLFDKHPTWLEYGIEKDVVYCLYCYLFKPESTKGGGDSFVGLGLNNWKKKENILNHEGKHNNIHNESRQKYEDLMKQKQSISYMFDSKTTKDKMEYRTLLTVAVDCVRFLLWQGLPFRGHDKSDQSHNQGNYLGLFHFLAERNEDVRNVSFSNAFENLQLTSPLVQNDICRATAMETINAIINDLGNSCFPFLLMSLVMLQQRNK